MSNFFPRKSDTAPVGQLEGRAETATHDVLTVLRARRVAVLAPVRERILSEKDPAQLERWFERASVAESIDGVLDEVSRAA